jgi:hypothetical protein
MTPPLVFISYCHEDEPYKTEVCTYLKRLEIEKHLQVWTDAHIATGHGWEKDIQGAIERADIAVLLVSTNFLNSDFINDVEMPLMRQRNEQEGLEIFPILAEDCLWDEVEWLRGLKLWSEKDAPTPVWSLEIDSRRRVLLKIARELSSLARKVRQQEPAPTETQPKPPKPPKPPLSSNVIAGPPSISPSTSHRKLLWCALALFATVFCFWLFCVSTAIARTNPSSMSFPPLVVHMPQHKFLVPEELEELRFGFSHNESRIHKARFHLPVDGASQCSIGYGGSNSVYDGDVENRLQKMGSVQVQCPWTSNYFGKPQHAGLELEGKVDNGSFKRELLPLYIAPLPHLKKVGEYLGFTLIAWATFFFYFLLKKAL